MALSSMQEVAVVMISKSVEIGQKAGANGRNLLLEAVLNGGDPPRELFEEPEAQAGPAHSSSPDIELTILYARRVAASGKLATAVRILERTLPEAESRDHAGSPSSARVMTTMGSILLSLEDYPRAEACLLQAIVLAEQSFGCRDPRTVEVLLLLTLLYLKKGDPIAGSNLRSLSIALFWYSADQEAASGRCVILFDFLHELSGGFRPSEDLLMRARRGLQLGGALDRVDAIEILLSLARVAADRGDKALGLQRCRETREEIRRLNGIRTADFVRVLRLEAAIHRESGDLRRALSVSRAAARIALVSPGFRLRDVGLALRDCGLMLSLCDRPKEATKFLERAMMILSLPAPAGREVADLLDLLVDLAESCQWHARAAMYRSRARAIRLRAARR